MAATISDSPRRYELNNVVEALIIFSKILDSEDSLGLTQLCKSSHLSKNKAFRLLATLERCGMIEKDQKGNYSICSETIGVARKILAKVTALDIARPYLKELAKLFNEAVYFADCKDGKAVFVDYVDCCHPVKATSFVGKIIQLQGSGTNVMFGNNVTGIGAITVDVGGADPDITTVAMPVVIDKTIGLGVLVVLAPSFRMPLDRIKTELVPVLREVMQRPALQLQNIGQDNSFEKHRAVIAGMSQTSDNSAYAARSLIY